MSEPSQEVPSEKGDGGNNEEVKESTPNEGHNEETIDSSTVKAGAGSIGEEAAAAAATAPPLAQPQQSQMSKNQLKRKRKWEQAMLVKQRRKQQEKEVKLAKAEKEGRDIDAERKEAEANRQQGDGWARRNQHWQEKFQQANSLLANHGKPPFEICLDCSFETKMSAKEINSLASQIRYCYASNKRAKYPTTVRVTSLAGSTLAQLQKVSGMDRWTHRAFYHTSQSILQAYAPNMIDAIKNRRDRPQFCYLTGDSETVLTELQDNTIYIIGGIVDRNRLKRAAIDRAQALGMTTARLPLTDYCNIVTTKVLTCNHVFDILLKYREHGGDWKQAFLDVLPHRKDVSAKQDGEIGSNNVEGGDGDGEEKGETNDVENEADVNRNETCTDKGTENEEAGNGGDNL